MPADFVLGAVAGAILTPLLVVPSRPAFVDKLRGFTGRNRTLPADAMAIEGSPLFVGDWQTPPDG